MTENRKNYFFWNKEQFLEGMRAQVCKECPLRSSSICQNPDPRGCAIFRRLPELVMIAQHLGPSGTSEQYIRIIEEHALFSCLSGSKTENCPYLDTLDCGLEPMMIRVLEAVRETDAVLESRSGYNGF